jgi:CubicO group peptidase (beta-lactamase class C family)
MIKIFKKPLVFLIISAISLGCSSSDYEFDGQRTEKAIMDRLDKVIVESLPKDKSISGVILNGDRIVWSKAFGVSNMKTQSLADTATIYRTGSISKPFTAFLMMLLAQDSIIKLNDPVELYLPDIKKLGGYSGATKITFLQLATHTSGLTREPDLPNAASGPIQQWESKILQAIPTTSFESKPGEKFGYSNIGYGILGLALSKAAGKPFIELIQERIFKPLHMKSSYFIVPQERISDLSAGIQELSGGGTDTKTPQLEHRGRGYKVPNGGIYSTPNDLAKFMMCLKGGPPHILADSNLAMMQKGFAGIGEKNYYGIGFFINQVDSLTIINHGGAVSGYTANFAFAKENKYGVIFMRNYSEGEPDIYQLPFALLKALEQVEE